MNYFIQRDGQQYGPYTLADLQRYVASGEIAVTDMATIEAGSDPVTVSHIIGSTAAPQLATRVAGQPTAVFPNPPNLHWGLLLLIDVLTCGTFIFVWDIVQSIWLRRLEPASKALYIYIGATTVLAGIFAISFAAALAHTNLSPITALLNLAYCGLILWARFSFRASMENHFAGSDPMGLSLSGMMTFFFGGLYFQYHINDIVRRKQQDFIFHGNR